MTSFSLRNIDKLLINPFFLNGLVWLFVILIYNLGWSSLCPALSDDMKIFLGINIGVSFLLGIITFFRNIVFFRPLKKFPIRAVKIWTVLLWILFIAEVIYSKGLPLIGYITGTADSTAYKEFGMPFVHVIVVNGFCILCIYAVYGYRSFKGREHKKLRRSLAFIAFMSLLPFILIFNRGSAMELIIATFVIVILSSRRPLRVMSCIAVALCAILWGFGYAGEMRMGSKFKRVILDIGKATTEFRSSGIPDEFFWAYVYISTPLANAQNTLNHSKNSSFDSDDLSNLILYEMAPEIVAKRLTGEGGGVKKITLRKESFLLTESLNAVSVYGHAPRYMGLSGLWALAIFTYVFIFINLKIVSRKSNWYLPMFIIIDMIILMNVFDNMFVFMGMIPQVMFVIAIYFFGKATRNMRRFTFRKSSRQSLIDPNLLRPLTDEELAARGR